MPDQKHQNIRFSDVNDKTDDGYSEDKINPLFPNRASFQNFDFAL